MKQEIKEKIKGKVILITGGTGSFGNSLVKKILELNTKKIIIFSRDEKKQFDMRNRYNSQILKFVIGDVRDKESVEKVTKGVDFIFHAAALKQVPTCEFFPMEAIKTNIYGAYNVMEAAARQNVSRVVILSTDKAVYPINTMGMTKALMEKTMIASSRSLNENGKRIIYSGARYGNVLYSRGSVIPHFINQIKAGNKLTVTNGQMTRFLLPLDAAIDLVLFALVKGRNGDMYVKKAPACTIETLAKTICSLFHYSKGYEIVGFRAGEKMHETLVSMEEMMRAKDLGDYFRIPSESQGLDYNKYHLRGDVANTKSKKPYTSENTTQLTEKSTAEVLLKIPEINEEINKYKNKRDFHSESSVYTIVD